MLSNQPNQPKNPLDFLFAGLSRKSRRRLRAEHLGKPNAQETVRYGANLGSADTGRKYSNAIWSDCPTQAVRDGTIDGVIFEDDFEAFALPGTQTTAIQCGRYAVFASSGAWASDAMPHSATPLGAGGIISALPGDGASVIIGTANCPFSLATTNVGKLWYEGRIATTSILTNAGQLFFGLAETAVTTYSVTIPLGNANAVSSALALVGFNRLEDGLGVLNTSYADHATSWTDIGAAANSTLAANTWIKLGMKFDPSNALRCLRFFVDGIECATAMTKAALLALTHLDAKGLGPCFGFYGDSEGSDYVYIDRWRCVQTFEKT